MIKRNIPLALPALSLMLGILIGRNIDRCDYSIFIGLITILLVCLSWIFRDSIRQCMGKSVLALLIVVTGILLVQRQTCTINVNHVSWFKDGAHYRFNGRISKLRTYKNGASSIIVNDISIKEKAYVTALKGSIKITCIEMDQSEISHAQELRTGDVIEFTGKLKDAYNFSNGGTFNRRIYEQLHTIGGYITLPSRNALRLVEKNNIPLLSLHGLRLKIEKLLSEWASRSEFNKDYRRTAVFLEAILLGERSGLSEDTSALFKKVGLYHILAISGLHVGILAGMLYFPTIFLFPHQLKFRVLSVMILLISYSFLTEGQPSVVRATIMICSYLIGTFFEREHCILNALALSAIILLLSNPLYLFDGGFLLTFSAVLSIVVLYDRVRLDVLPWLHKTFFGPMLTASLSVQLGISPLLSAMFGIIPLLSFVPFLVILPFITILLGLGFLFILMTIFSTTLASFLLWPLHIVVNLMIEVVERFSDFPLNTVVIGQMSLMITIFYYCILVMSIFREKFGKYNKFVTYGVITLFCLWLSFSAAFTFSQKNLAVTFLDVGDGDAIFCEFPNGNTLLIDGGGSERNSYNTAKHIIKPFFDRKAVHYLDFCLTTHSHADHILGLINLLDFFPVRNIFYQRRSDMPFLFREYTHILRTKNIPRIEIRSTDYNKLFRVNENNRSVVTKISYGQISFLLTGDIEKEAEQSLLRYGSHLKSTILKVPHHGSRSSSTLAFLIMVEPEMAIVSSSARNVHGHPHHDVLQRLSTSPIGVPVYITGKTGALTISTDGRTYSLSYTGKDY